MKCASSFSVATVCSSGSIHFPRERTGSCSMPYCGMSHRGGVWVSAHPDVILKMGVKEVLYRTKHFGWGTDTHLYRTAGVFREKFPLRLRSAGPRVLKQNRGNGGQGVWKVELISAPTHDAAIARVLHARRGSVPEDLPLGEFMRQCEAYFTSEGCMVDQPFQPRLPDGMIRCYMGADKVVGFGHQLIRR
jgi:hypothetical protein